MIEILPDYRHGRETEPFHPETFKQAIAHITPQLENRLDVLEKRLAFHMFEATTTVLPERHQDKPVTVNVPTENPLFARAETQMLEPDALLRHHRQAAELDVMKAADQLRLLRLDIKNATGNAVFHHYADVGNDTGILRERTAALAEMHFERVRNNWPADNHPYLY